MLVRYPAEDWQSVAERTINYFSPAATERHSPAATRIALVLTLLLPVAFVSYVLLRRHQLSLPDPYNNPYTAWSTACLLALPVLALADAITIAVWRRRIGHRVLVFALVLLSLVALLIVWFIVGLLRFLFP